MAKIIKEQHWHSDCYKGAAEDLIREGIIKPDQVPGLPGNPKTCITFFEGEIVVGRQIPQAAKDERYMHVQRQGRKLVVRKGLPEAEAQVRRKANDEERARMLDRQRMREQAERDLEKIPESEDDCRRFLVRRFREELQSLLTMILPVRVKGYALAEESAQSILISADAVVEAIMEAEFSFDAGFEQQCRATIAAADRSFQKHLAGLTRENLELLEEGEQS